MTKQYGIFYVTVVDLDSDVSQLPLFDLIKALYMTRLVSLRWETINPTNWNVYRGMMLNAYLLRILTWVNGLIPKDSWDKQGPVLVLDIGMLFFV